MPVVFVAYDVIGRKLPIIVKCNIDRFRMPHIWYRPVSNWLTNPRKCINNAMMIDLINNITSNIISSSYEKKNILNRNRMYLMSWKI